MIAIKSQDQIYYIRLIHLKIRPLRLLALKVCSCCLIGSSNFFLFGFSICCCRSRSRRKPEESHASAASSKYLRRHRNSYSSIAATRLLSLVSYLFSIPTASTSYSAPWSTLRFDSSQFLLHVMVLSAVTILIHFIHSLAIQNQECPFYQKRYSQLLSHFLSFIDN